MLEIAIIGSASAKKNLAWEQILNKTTWIQMVEIVETYIQNFLDMSDNSQSQLTETDWSKVKLVSGGAAWSDHIAVYLYLKHPESKLTLHFPTQWDSKLIQFVDNGASHWSKNPGQTANAYHRHFKTKTGISSLDQIQQAIAQGATIKDHYTGFHDRNLVVGQSPVLIAFSFGSGDAPTDGGTFHTWKNAKSRTKIYHNLLNLI